VKARVPAASAGVAAAEDPGAVRLGLRPNLGQFALLVAVNALVGGMVGQERTVLPLVAGEVFGLAALSAALTFIVAFGLTKAVTNFAAGALSDRYGRKPVLAAGWLVGLPVPLLLIWATGWEWVVLANVLLGVNQGLTWSTTVIMKIDLVGPARRGLAMGSTRRPATALSPSRRSRPASSRSAGATGRHRSCWGSPTPGWVSVCGRSSSARPAATRVTRRSLTTGASTSMAD